MAFGHRRLKAVVALGRKVRAVVRAMSDVELVIAQGIENSQREGPLLYRAGDVRGAIGGSGLRTQCHH